MFIALPPRLHCPFRLSNINQTAKILCDSLPRTILCQLTSVPIVSLYRDLMADALLRQSESLVREKLYTVDVK